MGFVSRYTNQRNNDKAYSSLCIISTNYIPNEYMSGIPQKHDNMYHIRKNYTLKSIYDDENEYINYTLSGTKE